MSEPEAPPLLPVTDDHDTGPLFEAAARGELVVRVCACGEVSHLPTSYCRRCGSSEGTWRTVSGRATLLSWTTVTHQLHPAFPTPYTIVLVSLEEHPQVHMFGQLAGTPDLTADQPMEVWFQQLAEDVAIPQWRPAG